MVHAGISAGEKVLDVACGTGWETLAAARAVGKPGHVTGVDIAEKALSLSTRQVVTVVLPTTDGRTLKIRKGIVPEPVQREIYTTLKIPLVVVKPVKTWQEQEN